MTPTITATEFHAPGAAAFLTVAFGYARHLSEAPALPVGFVVAAARSAGLPGTGTVT